MKKTIIETRQLMNKLNEFLSEAPYLPNSNAKRAANDFLGTYNSELEQQFGNRWQTQGGDWALDDNNMKWLHDTIYEFASKNYPEHMGTREGSEQFVQSVMDEIQ